MKGERENPNGGPGQAHQEKVTARFWGDKQVGRVVAPWARVRKIVTTPFVSGEPVVRVGVTHIVEPNGVRVISPAKEAIKPFTALSQVEGVNPSGETKESREIDVISTISEIEVPFMSALQRAYLDRGWRICGPASIALSRVLNHLTGVPIQKGGTGEHIELEIGIFDPKDDPKRAERVEEQTYLRYYTGKGDVYYIDPIYGLLMEGRQEMAGAIQVEKYGVDEIDQALIGQHNLYPFDPYHDGLELGGFFAKMTPTVRQSAYAATMGILHDERATMRYCLADSGAQAHFDWYKTVPVIKEIAPGWEEDHEAIRGRIEAYSAAVFGDRRRYPSGHMREPMDPRLTYIRPR